jgi:hypothetical protein
MKTSSKIVSVPQVAKFNAVSQVLGKLHPSKASPQKASDTFQVWVDRANKAKDKPFDGKLVGAGAQTFAPGTPLAQIPGVQPEGKPGHGTIVYINGMLTPLTQQLQDMKDIANTTGAQVVGVHNATEGLVGDSLQSSADVAGVGKNAAVASLTQTLIAELSAGRPVHLIAHSQGAVITQRALHAVKASLGAEKLGLLTVETFGGAGGLYPDGPKYTHYINTKDMVPNMFGLGWDGSLRNKGAGKGAEVIHFEYTNPDTILQHLLDTAYLPRRRA